MLCIRNTFSLNLRNISLIILMLIEALVLFPISSKGEPIQNHIVQCCSLGKSKAGTDCTAKEILMDFIPPVWRGLCLSTFSMCCSKEFQTQQCLAGRDAAKTGGNCDVITQHNTTSSYTDCCKACQIGLAVAASGHNCSSNQFAYFQKDESFLICCEEMYLENNSNNSINDIHISGRNDHSSNTHDSDDDEVVDEDETFVLNENEDICSKFDKQLCPQICENTRESYVCKCFDGYKLDDNKVTCSKILDDTNYNHVTDDSDDDDDDDDIDSLDENSDSFNDAMSCPIGFTRNNLTNECEDINECYLNLDTQCSPFQYCFNTIGSYSCLEIKGTKCEDGYHFNTKTEECEDYDECQENPCGPGYICVNYPGRYECTPIKSRSAAVPVEAGGRISKNPLSSGVCGAGYTYKNNRCVDIDECVIDKHACDANQVCENENGGYRCDCKIGFKMDSTLNACVDINECQINNHNCLPTQRCDNTMGSYTCIRLQNCGTGYTLNAETGNCDDDDECELNIHDCPPDYNCRNTIGSFRCDRKRHTTSRYNVYPYTTSSKQSPKPRINQVLTTTRRPTSTSTTSTTEATTTTTTTTTESSTHSDDTTSTSKSVLQERQETPYYLPIRPPTPTPITVYRTTTTTTSAPVSPIYYNRLPNTEDSNYVNRNYSASRYYTNPPHRFNVEQETRRNYFTEPCNTGFYRNAKGACIDIDECQIPGTCASHQRCINTNGSYRCHNLLQCSGGYKASIDGTSCVDIDECVTGEHNCGPDQICRNRIGGYICSCPAGHMLNNDNRCVDKNECEHNVCPMNANCVNTVGSYYCDCKPGFKKQHDRENICIDLDECQETPGLCEQKCINFWGSYRCACNPGYELNMYNNRTCDDIDECEVHSKYQLCTGICNNVPGSYECSCPPGYELGTDKSSCRDIDECQTMNICDGRNEICTNTRGGYKCTYVYCPDGYTNDIDQKNRCRLINNMCEGDECYNKPSSYTYNFITLVSNMLIPPHGRTFFSLRGPSWYENIDFDLKLVQTQARPGIEKATMHHFSTTVMHNQVQLNLLRTLEGPQDIELELSMTVFMNGQPRGKSIAKVFIFVSQYSF